MAHITGGGLVENIIRVVPKDFGLEIDTSQLAAAAGVRLAAARRPNACASAECDDDHEEGSPSALTLAVFAASWIAPLLAARAGPAQQPDRGGLPGCGGTTAAGH
jgi:hypothetical protein